MFSTVVRKPNNPCVELTPWKRKKCILDIPDEMWVLVFHFLNYCEISLLRTTCYYFHLFKFDQKMLNHYWQQQCHFIVPTVESNYCTTKWYSLFTELITLHTRFNISLKYPSCGCDYTDYKLEKTYWALKAYEYNYLLRKRLRMTNYCIIKRINNFEFKVILSSNALMVFACRYDYPTILQMLLSNPKNYKNSHDNVIKDGSLLCLSCRYKSFNCIKYLIENYPNINDSGARNWCYTTLLQMLLNDSYTSTYDDRVRADIKIVRCIINNKHPLIQSGRLFTAAIRYHKFDWIRYLLNNYSNNININVSVKQAFEKIMRDSYPYYQASSVIAPEMYAIIVKHCYNHNLIEPIVENPCTDVYKQFTINTLIDCSDYYDICRKYNRRCHMTLLHLACYYGSVELVTFLVEKGADITAMAVDRCFQDNTTFASEKREITIYQTPLFIACRKGNKKIIKMLLEFAAKDIFIGKTILNNVMCKLCKDTGIKQYCSIFSAKWCNYKEREIIHFVAQTAAKLKLI